MLAEAARAILGVAFLAWIPGHLWRRVLMPRAAALPGIAIDIVLSVSLMTLSLLLASDLLRIPLTAPTVMWMSMAWSLAAAAVLVIRRQQARGLKPA